MGVTVDRIIILLVLSIVTVVLGFKIYNTFIVTDAQYTELRLEKQAVTVVKDSVENMFYQPNSAIDIVKIPTGVYLRIYSENNTLYIESKNYYEVVPNVRIDEPVLTNGGTLIIKRVLFNNTTNILLIEITR